MLRASCYCRLQGFTLLKITAAEEPDEQCCDDERKETEQSSRTCPHCQSELVCVESSERPSWRDLFADYSTCPWWYPAAGYRQPARQLYPAEP